MIHLDLTRSCLVLPLCLLAVQGALDGRPPEETPDQPTVARGLEAWPPEQRAHEREVETRLLEQIVPGRLAGWHEQFASEPHDAGTPGDAMIIRRLAEWFESMGFEVELHEFWAYLSEPVFAEVEVLVAGQPARTLELKERVLDEDPWSMHPDLRPGWNAYAATGDVTGQVVYANYGRKQDFERLAELGVDCAQKIVICRYGGNYRGYKVKFAEQAGAAGVLIYTDPADSGWSRGVSYPEGGWANEWSIQRGSIKTLPYQGDPLTPFVEATRDAERLDPDDVALPRIPVQPLGWGAAQQILGRMRGESVPQEWQGGLPQRYRLTGGPDLNVHLTLLVERKLVKTANVVGVLRGAEFPGETVLLGCHHDAWGFGAADPSAGMIVLMEAARAWSELARNGAPPARSIAFAAWGAEEHGIVGSVEWVEKHLERLQREAVAYINLDMAAMGLNLRSSASPSLQATIADAASAVPAAEARGSQGIASALDAWLGHSAAPNDLPSFGDLGGGSDHVGFIALGGVPCASLGAGGSSGVSYHSIYDSLSWYRQVVGQDYASAQLITNVAALLAARLANAPTLPLDPARYGPETARHLLSLTARGRATGLFEDGDSDLAPALLPLAVRAEQFAAEAAQLRRALDRATAAGRLDSAVRAAIDAHWMACDRAWLDPEGLPDRPWYRNRFAATDEDSGYAAWMLPFLRRAVERADAEQLESALAELEATFDAMSAELAAVRELAGIAPVEINEPGSSESGSNRR